MAVAMTNAFPLMIPDTTPIESLDTDRAFRKMIASLLLPDVKSANPLAVRNGVIPHTWDNGGGYSGYSTCSSLRVQPNSGSTHSVVVCAGPAVVERSGQGPYVAWLEADSTLTVPNGDPSNPRWDVVYAWVGDQVSFVGVDPSHGPKVDVLVGTPSATPTVPTGLPDGAVALANVYSAANNSGYFGSAAIVDVRKSTALLGGTRYMLPGDSLSDPGRVGSERRLRQPVAPFPMLEDYWDAVQGKWRGTQGFTLTGVFPGTPDSASLVRGLVPTSGSTIISVNIPDPGWPYRIAANATMQQYIASGESSSSCNYVVRTSGGTFVSCIYNQAGAGTFTLLPTGDTVFNGSQTVVLAAAPINGVAARWQADVRNKLYIRVDPA